MKTLFGDTEDTLLRQMRMEDQERVRQARLLDKQSGGNYYSGLIADAAQQQANVFSNLLPKGVRAVGGLLGQEDAAGKIAAGMEDPRLGKARQRKADLDMLSKRYETLGSDEDGFTDTDAKTIVDDLMSLGYLEEAKKMAEIWQGRRIADAKKATAAKEGDVKWGTTRTIVDNDPTSPTYRQKFFTVQRRVGSGVETVTTPVGGGTEEFQGDLKKAEIISTQYGETAVEALQRRINRMEARSGFKKGEIKYKADYELTVREQEAWNTEKFTEIGKAPVYAQNMNQADTLLGLLEKIPNSGGLAANIQEVTDFFGVTPANITEFDAKTREYVTTQLQMMGRNPTDFDLKFLLKVNPGMLKSRSGNLRLLTLLKEHNRRKYELARDLGSGDYSRDRWYKKILIPAEDRLKKWRKKREELFGEPNVPNPDSVKANRKRKKIIPDGRGNFKTEDR